MPEVLAAWASQPCRSGACSTMFGRVQDIQMPKVDGLEATRTIRSIEAAAAAAVAAASAPQQTCQEAIRNAAAPAPSGTPQLRRVPIVGVSACTEQDQLKSAALQGLPIDPATGGAPVFSTRAFQLWRG